MEHPTLSMDISDTEKYFDRIETILKIYYRVWMNHKTKELFIKPEKIESFNHLFPWSIDIRNLNVEISLGFHKLEVQIKKGITDTKKQGKIKWYTMGDITMQYYCNDISYRIRSMWDKLAHIINIYFLKNEVKKNKVSIFKVKNKLKNTEYSDLYQYLFEILNSVVFKNLNEYRKDFTHNITQELANRYKLHGKYWHTDDLIELLINSYIQITKAIEYTIHQIESDAALTRIVDFKEMHDKTP